jgi:hypothetical protein
MFTLDLKVSSNDVDAYNRISKLAHDFTEELRKSEPDLVAKLETTYNPNKGLAK